MRHASRRTPRAAAFAALWVLLAAALTAPAQDIRRGSGPEAAPPPPPNIRSRPPKRVARRTPTRRQPTPEAADAVPTAQAAAHYDKGNELFDQNKIDGAIAEYDEAIRLFPRYADAWLMLGNAYYDRANLDEAIRAWQRALVIDDTLYQAHQNLANASYARQEYETSVKAYQAVARLRPNYADAYAGLGNSLMQLRRYEEAVPQFERAVAANGGRYPEVRLHLAYAYMRLKEPAKAQEAVQKAIDEAGPDSEESAVMWNALGLLLYDKSDYTGAANAFTKMIELCKGCAKETLSQAYFNQSLALEAMGKRAEAANALDEYLRLAPYVTNKQDIQKRIERLRGSA
jgi:tetratricopeptide (TPR) repeat protein